MLKLVGVAVVLDVPVPDPEGVAEADPVDVLEVVGPVAVPVPVELGAVEVGELVAVVCAPILNVALVEYTSLTLLGLIASSW